MLGLLTGISYVSGLDYYRGINERVTAAREPGYLMPPNPPMVLASMDCDVYAHHLTEGSFDDVSSYSRLDGVIRLVDVGCTWLAIASNTGHICVPAVEDRFPDLPVLHIADCAAHELKQAGHTLTGLIGTKPTMESDYLKDRFRRHGIDTLVPPDEATRDEIYRIIFEELSFERFAESSRSFAVQVIRDLAAAGADACVSGCTEIELLVEQRHIPDVSWVPSAELHIATIADVLLGVTTLDEVLP